MASDIVITLAPQVDVDLQVANGVPSLQLLLSPIFKGEPGAPGVGTPGPPGPPGAAGGSAYIYTQANASTNWTINHQLGRFPSVTVVDSTTREVEGDVKYVDANNVTVSFAYPFAGQAFLN